MPTADTQELLDRLAQATLTARPVSKAPPAPPRLASHLLLTALQRAGTRHIYADTADVDELAGVARIQSGVLREEIDGNTANQPLVRKAIERGLDEAALRRWDHALRAAAPSLSWAQRAPWLYALLCARLGTEIVDAFGVGRPWEISLQLHMDLLHDPHSAVRVGQCLAALVPGVLVKVPFAPDAPQCFLIARELELNGFPVNFTSTFSARQVVAAALLADVTRTNIFLGRLDQGLQAEGLGEHVVLEAQRALLDLRRHDTVKARLIAASVREWRTIPALAGCDVFTIPCKVLAEFLEQTEVDAASIHDQRQEPSADRVRVGADALAALGSERIDRLHHVEPEFLAFLRRFRDSAEWTDATLDEGEALAERFEREGFGDLFHQPTAADDDELQESKLPQLDGALVRRLALDTHYSLLANADFARHQEAIDAQLERAAAGTEGQAAAAS
jgi:transaldolase